MKREKLIILSSILASFLSFSTVLAIPCAFYGTMKVDGNPANGIYVTAHLDSNGQYLATATEPPAGFGHYTITVDAAGEKIRFKYRNVWVNEPAQDCVSGIGTKLDLTLSCVDCDGDGYNYTVDCDESNPNIHPDATEVCNGIDDNCDGIIDDFSESCYTGPEGTLNKGICKAGSRTCTNGSWSACNGEVLPQTETCNGKDDDCDGIIDEGVCGGGGGGGGGGGKTTTTTTTVITTTETPQTTISSGGATTTETTQVTTSTIPTTVPSPTGITGAFLAGLASIGYWWILIIIIIILLIVYFARRRPSRKKPYEYKSKKS